MIPYLNILNFAIFWYAMNRRLPMLLIAMPGLQVRWEYVWQPQDQGLPIL
jgi:hypothetical protein